MAMYPFIRPRRLRQTEQLRLLVRETELSINHFIYPLFISEEISKSVEISAMPGVFQWTLKDLAKEATRIYQLGIPAVLLFGIPSEKDDKGSQAYATKGIIQEAIKVIKKAVPELIVIADVCLCEYMSHGHCGVIDKNGTIKNDESLELLAKTALSQVAAGADIVAPSNMMDYQVGSIRKILDENGFINTPIMSYSAKFASGFYGPFRLAAQSAPQFGDRKAYQMDPANVREAMREHTYDTEEGADMLMVKPAMAYMDVIRATRERYDLPIAAYNVSGEYSMVKAAARNGWIDEKRVAMELLTGIKRAGADIIISYFAPQVSGWLKEHQ
ncbi:MAG: porphobilinogen synthase [Candidatus Levyibacteriota bacterium]